MPKYNLTPKKLICILYKHGFYFIRQNGSHAIFKNLKKNLKVVVPIHSKDIPRGTIHAILKDAQITL
ncbi:type II toxin-antitoxin system HicA family toxin [Candidatus Peregrinibacteria bacterium]|nr:type II toxin-antitoxin system HicA family toxin [Candidatus Peregrinibacteria bacterium]